MEQDSIHRSVALKLAAKYATAPETATSYTLQVTELFNFYLKLLRGEGQQDATVAHHQATK
jgi:hypothetical protein